MCDPEVVILSQCFRELLELFQLVTNTKDLLLLQESQVVLHCDQQRLHLAAPAKERSSRASPHALSAIILLLRAGFPEDVSQFA
jgi:hypothetical protein